MDVSDVEGWGLAINESRTLLATVNSLSEVSIYSIDDSGLQKPGTPTITFHGQNEGVINPQQVCFVARGGVETLLLADFGSYKYAYVAEISITGVFIRSFSVFAAFGKGKKGLKAFGMACSNDLIAATYCDFDRRVSGVVVFQFSGDMLRNIATPYLPKSIAFSADETHLLLALGARHAPLAICTASIATPPHAIVPKVVFPDLIMSGRYYSPMMQVGDDDSLVIAHCREDEAVDTEFTDILFVNADGTVARRASVPSDVVAFAWLGKTLCCRSFDGDVYLVGDDGSVVFVPNKDDGGDE